VLASLKIQQATSNFAPSCPFPWEGIPVNTEGFAFCLLSSLFLKPSFAVNAHLNCRLVFVLKMCTVCFYFPDSSPETRGGALWGQDICSVFTKVLLDTSM